MTAEEIVSVMETEGIRAGEVAAAAGLEKSYVSRMLSGQRPLVLQVKAGLVTVLRERARLRRQLPAEAQALLREADKL